MKRLFTIVICLTLSHITQASTLFNTKLPADSGNGPKRDTMLRPAISGMAYSPYQNMFKRRLDSIQKQVPLDYNDIVQGYIDTYTNRKADIGRMLGLAKYYFPIYEKAFREAGIPEEIKFLSIVESELNPNAVSRVGATGPWQFMYATGKMYGLNINDEVDERRDPIQASYAAAAYIKDAYMEFGDWLLAIASYNCGKSTIERAMDRAGGAGDFWSIRQYLPNETRGYVPAYIAVSYIMNCYSKHSITPQNAYFNIKTDTVMINKPVSFSNIAATLSMSAGEIALLNPAYKRGVINASSTAPRRLILPQVTPDKYIVLYNALNGDSVVAYTPPPVYVVANPADHRPTERPAYHLVKKNETVAAIADRYGVEEQDLKAWNNLHTDYPEVGKQLKLNQAVANIPLPVEKKETKKYRTYTVKKGDTLSSLAEKFEASVDSIKEMNGLKKNSLQPGMTLKITKV